ncbi:putative RNA-directed DNA polymerase from transposon X-element [Trichonephila clavipes]|nr:putative RNA-directed DNA polymerase from transposon X-element [Trichonephila clavipes]
MLPRRPNRESHIEALSPFRSIPPLKGALGSTAITPIEKAEVIADSLQEQFKPNHVAGREDFDQRIHDEVTNFINTPHVQEIEPTTPTEVLTYVQRLKPRKSPGLDQISNRMIKNLPLKFLLFITLLIPQTNLRQTLPFIPRSTFAHEINACCRDTSIDHKHTSSFAK